MCASHRSENMGRTRPFPPLQARTSPALLYGRQGSQVDLRMHGSPKDSDVTGLVCQLRGVCGGLFSRSTRRCLESTLLRVEGHRLQGHFGVLATMCTTLSLSVSASQSSRMGKATGHEGHSSESFEQRLGEQSTGEGYLSPGRPWSRRAWGAGRCVKFGGLAGVAWALTSLPSTGTAFVQITGSLVAARGQRFATCSGLVQERSARGGRCPREPARGRLGTGTGAS